MRAVPSGPLVELRLVDGGPELAILERLREDRLGRDDYEGRWLERARKSPQCHYSGMSVMSASMPGGNKSISTGAAESTRRAGRGSPCRGIGPSCGVNRATPTVRAHAYPTHSRKRRIS
eukprot:15445576-Alexandrium_andersonii.AAC.1